MQQIVAIRLFSLPQSPLLPYTVLHKHIQGLYMALGLQNVLLKNVPHLGLQERYDQYSLLFP